MGSQIADLFMEAFEEQTLATAPEPPRIWKRYVNDTFIVMKQQNAYNFLSHLNQQHPSIRFTMETENNNKIAFLDTLVTREPDGKLLTSVYRNPHTPTSTSPMFHTIHNLLNAVLPCVYMIELNASSPSHTEQPRRKNIYPQFSSPTATLRPSYRRWPQPESNTREGNSRIQVYRSAAMHQRSLRTPPPPSTATSNTHRLKIRHHTKISAGQSKRFRWPKQARQHSLQDTMHMRQSLHRGDRKTHAGKNERTRQRYTTRTHSEFRGFRTR